MMILRHNEALDSSADDSRAYGNARIWIQAPLVGDQSAKFSLRVGVALRCMTLLLATGMGLASVDASAQGTRGSATGQQQPLIYDQGLYNPTGVGTIRGSASGGTIGGDARGSADLGVSPVDAQGFPIQGGSVVQGAYPILAGQNAGGLPLVSDDYETLMVPGMPTPPPSSGFGQLGGGAPSGPAQSYLNLPGSQFGPSGGASGGGLPSSGMVSSGARPSGPPRSTLFVPSPSNIDYDSLPSSMDSVSTARSTTTPQRNVSSSDSGSSSSDVPTLRPIGSLPSMSGGSTSTARPSSSNSSPILSQPPSSSGAGTGSSLSLSRPPADDTTRPNLPALPSLAEPGSGPSLGGTPPSPGSGPSLGGSRPSLGSGPSLGAARAPSNFQVTGYSGTDTSVPISARGPLSSLAAAMNADPDITVSLVSYAQPQSGFSALTLSATRAVAVRKFLISRGISEDRVSVRARGDNNGTVSSSRIEVQIDS